MTNQRCWAHFPDPSDPTGPFIACTNAGERYENKHTGKDMYACAAHAPRSGSWVSAPIEGHNYQQLLTGQEP